MNPQFLTKCYRTIVILTKKNIKILNKLFIKKQGKRKLEKNKEKEFDIRLYELL